MGITGSAAVWGKKREQNRAAGCCETRRTGLVVAHGLALGAYGWGWWMRKKEEEKTKSRRRREFRSAAQLNVPACHRIGCTTQDVFNGDDG
jgi:hypothetical protein